MAAWAQRSSRQGDPRAGEPASSQDSSVGSARIAVTAARRRGLRHGVQGESTATAGRAVAVTAASAVAGDHDPQRTARRVRTRIGAAAGHDRCDRGRGSHGSGRWQASSGGDRAQGDALCHARFFKAARKLIRKALNAKPIARCARGYIRLSTIVKTSRYLLSQSLHTARQKWLRRPLLKLTRTTSNRTIPRRIPNPTYRMY